MKKSKYKNIKTVVDGIKFDSKKEAKRYKELVILQRAKEISDLELQPRYDLIPKLVINNVTHRLIFYKADFRYKDKNGKTVVEDVKGMKTAVYGLKKRLVKMLHDVDINEI